MFNENLEAPPIEQVENSESVDRSETDVAEVETTENQKSKLRKVIEFLILTFGVTFIATVFLLTPDKNGEIKGINILAEIAVRVQLEYSKSEANQIVERMQEITGTTENPHYQTHAEIIQEAVVLYGEQNPESQVFFPRTEFSDVEIMSILGAIVSDAWSYSEGNPVSFAQQLSYTNSTSVFHEAPQDFGEFMWAAKQTYPIFPGSTFDLETKDMSYSERERYFEAQMQQILSDFETMYQNQGELLRQAQVLAYFLERNDGNMYLAMADMSVFYKWVLRRSILQQDIQWFYDHILDQTNPEFSLNSFPNLGELPREDADTITSIIGLNYHDYGIIIFQYFGNTSLTQIGVVAEYFEYDHVAEPYKVRQDYELLLTLDDLPLIGEVDE